MEQSNITQIIIQTINSIFETLLSSIDNNLYGILDEMTFIDSNILHDNYFEKIFGTSTTNGILLIANSLFLGIIITIAIQDLGKNLFGKTVCFSELISVINNSVSIEGNSLNIFSLDGLLKTTMSVSLLGLVFSYSLRYIMIKIFILLAPFAILSSASSQLSWFFKAWSRNLFSLLIQIIVAIILLILFSMNYDSGNLFVKFSYIGGIYALLRANSFVREFIGGVSTVVSQGVGKFTSANF